MSRLFSFGCSFTNYGWITMADFVGLAFDKHYNFGQGGACNTFIKDQLIIRDKEYNFDPDTDFILIGITGVPRFSYLNENDYWITTGDILPGNTNHPAEIKNFAKTMFNFNFGIHNSVVALRYIRMFLEHKKIKHLIYPAIDNSVYFKLAKDNPGLISDDKHELLTELCDSFDMVSLEEISKLPEFKGYTFTKGGPDGHPSIDAHYYYAETILPEYVNSKTKEIREEQKRLFIYESCALQSAYFRANFGNQYRAI